MPAPVLSRPSRFQQQPALRWLGISRRGRGRGLLPWSATEGGNSVAVSSFSFFFNRIHRALVAGRNVGESILCTTPFPHRATRRCKIREFYSAHWSSGLSKESGKPRQSKKDHEKEVQSASGPTSVQMPTSRALCHRYIQHTRRVPYIHVADECMARTDGLCRSEFLTPIYLHLHGFVLSCEAL